MKENDDKLAELGESIEAFSDRVLMPISTLTSRDASEDLIDQANQLLECGTPSPTCLLLI